MNYFSWCKYNLHIFRFGLGFIGLDPLWLLNFLRLRHQDSRSVNIQFTPDALDRVTSFHNASLLKAASLLSRKPNEIFSLVTQQQAHFSLFSRNPSPFYDARLKYFWENFMRCGVFLTADYQNDLKLWHNKSHLGVMIWNTADDSPRKFLFREKNRNKLMKHLKSKVIREFPHH